METLCKIDSWCIAQAQAIAPPFSRVTLFVIYFWFGILKILDVSPAHPLVAGLLARTIPFITFNQFIALFSIYEMVIGILFLMPRFTRLALVLLAFHLVTTVLPLFLLPEIAWRNFLIPTLEGQYIIKNLLIISLALYLLASLKPKSAPLELR